MVGKRNARGDKPRAKILRWRGLLDEIDLKRRLLIVVLLMMTSTALSFTQLGFLGIGAPGEYTGYALTLFIPIVLAALLLGRPWGTLLGLFSGIVMYAHSALMPLDYYELMFVNLTSSIVMLTIAGFLLDMLFAVALRNNPGGVKRVVYLVLVCAFVSYAYSFGFFLNGIVSIVSDLVADGAVEAGATSLSVEAQSRAVTALARMGDVGMQAFVDTVVMVLNAIVADLVARKVLSMRGNVGLRMLFGSALAVVVACAFMVTAGASFISITRGERDTAFEKMQSEVDYLCTQMSVVEKHSQKLGDLFDDLNIDVYELSDKNIDQLFDTISYENLLDGYTPEDDGYIVITAAFPELGDESETIMLADDPHFSANSSLSSYVGDDVLKAIDTSLETGQPQRIVFDKTYSAALVASREVKESLDESTQAQAEGPAGENAQAQAEEPAAESAQTQEEGPAGENAQGQAEEAAVDSVEETLVERLDVSERTEEELAEMRERAQAYRTESVTDVIDSYIDTEIAYLLSKKQGPYTVTLIMPSSLIFADRNPVMLWTSLSFLVLQVAVFLLTFFLLRRVVVRRIDETNSTLAKVTAGDLKARVNVSDPREFGSLSAGINETVEALEGWIAEAETRMDAELATAKAIQEAALPRIFPPYPDFRRFDIYATMNAAREVGGDFYDFFLIGDNCNPDEGKLGFVIADVSGKGVPAALFMMKAKTQIHDYLASGMEVGEAVENVNRLLCDGNDTSMFVTAWVGVLDYATGHIDFVNAGHNPPLLWSIEETDQDGDAATGAPSAPPADPADLADPAAKANAAAVKPVKRGAWRWVSKHSGLPLGLFDGLPYQAHSLECGIGDQLLLYTDGVTEAMSEDEELYGEARLEALANESFTMHPRQLVNAIRRSVAIHAAGAVQSDDITILALEVGVPPEVTATIVLPALVEELPHVNEFIHTELDRRLCPVRVQNQLDIAVEELFVNVARYAYPHATPDDPGSVSVSYTYSAEPPSILVTISDEGIAYNPLAKPDAVTPDDIMEVPIGGLGILMAKNSVDEMTYERIGERNVVSLVKKW